jgi:hypothetical protein
MRHSAKEVASAYPSFSSLAGQDQTGGWAEGFQPTRSVWTVLIEVLLRGFGLASSGAV